MKEFTVFAADVTFIVTVTCLLVVDASSDPTVESEYGCLNSTCSATEEPNCDDCDSNHAVAIGLISVVICLLPPITWGVVIWYACKTDPAKQMRRRRRRQLHERTLNETADPENVQMEEQLPPSYEDHANYPLYNTDTWATGGGVGMTNVTVVSADGVTSAAVSSADGFHEPPPPSYEAATKDSVIQLTSEILD